MKNFDKIIEKWGLDFVLKEVAYKRINLLNLDRFDQEYFMFECDNGNQYYWMEDAVEAEIAWLKEDANDDPL